MMKSTGTFPKSKKLFSFFIALVLVIGTFSFASFADTSVKVHIQNGDEASVLGISVVMEEPEPGISIDKTASATSITAGGSVRYTLTVANTGNVPLTDVTVSDEMMDSDWNIGSLDAEATVTHYYDVTLNTAGPVTNTAIVTANYGDQPLSAEDAVAVSVSEATSEPEPGISIGKTASAASITAGGSVRYTLVVTNTGNVPLTDVTVTDDMMDSDWNIGSLDAGATVTHDYDVTLDTAGPVINTAIVTASYGDQPLSANDAVAVSVSEAPPEPEPGISIDKTASATSITAGGSVRYTLTVTNTGNVPLTDVTVSDDMMDSDWNIGSLDAGATVTHYYDVTLDTAGPVNNTAIVTANYGDQPLSAEDAVAVTVNEALPEYAAGISIEKTASATSISTGESVTYTLTVTNTGNVELSDVKVSDDMMDSDWIIGSLAAGTSPVTYSYDVDFHVAGTFNNTATVTASYGNETLSDDDSIEVSVYETPPELVPDISIEKTVSPGTTTVGRTVTYTLTVTNTGTMYLTNVRVSDPMMDGDWVIGGMAPDEEATHTYTKSFAQAGRYSNTATVTGYYYYDPYMYNHGETMRTDDYQNPENSISDEDTATVTVTQPETNSPPTVQTVTLTVSIEGQGTVSPGAGTYTRDLGSTAEFSNIAPADGWTFDGWYGSNGSEVSGNKILMNGNKSVTARFVQTVAETEAPVPENAPEINTDDSQDTVILDQSVPQGTPELPKTGGIPFELITGLGALLAAGGFSIRKHSKKDK